MSHTPAPRRSGLWRAFLAACWAVLAMGSVTSCGSSTGPGDTPVATVLLSDTVVTVRVGDQAVLVAHARGANGTELVGRPIFWSSRDPSVVNVSQAGVVQGLVVGTTQVAASAEGQSSLATVTVLPRPVTTLQVTPATFQLVVNGRQRLTARALNDVGAVTAATVTWKSLTPSVATVSADGEVVAVAPGAASIQAAADGVTATAAVVVTPVPVASVKLTPVAPSLVVGATQQLTATAVDASGATLAGRTILWTSRDPGIAVVSSSGQVTGIAPGSTSVVATVEGQSATATVTVTAAPVAVTSVQVTPTSATLFVGATRPFTAVAKDASGNTVSGRMVTWSSGASNVLSVSGAGVVTGVGAGTAQVLAQVDGITGTASVTVQPVPVASVVVSPRDTSVPIGGRAQFTASPHDAAGNVLGGRAIMWTSSNETVATVTSTGLVSGVGVGTATIRATSEGVTGSAPITVKPVVHASPDSVAVRDKGNTKRTAQLAATDEAGRSLPNSEVTWSSSDPSIATVDNTGLVRGISSGSGVAIAYVTVTYRGATAKAKVVVSPQA